MNTAEAQVIVAVVATGGVVIAALIPVWWQITRMRIEHRDTNDQMTQVNDAVNHRHARGVDAPSLYDAVLENRVHLRELLAWKRHWEGIDPGFNSASRLNEHMADIHREIGDLRLDFDSHIAEESK